MRLQNTTSCTEDTMPYMNKNIFNDHLSLPALCVCLSSTLSDQAPKCAHLPKCAVQIPAGGKMPLEGDFESRERG